MLDFRVSVNSHVMTYRNVKCRPEHLEHIMRRGSLGLCFMGLVPFLGPTYVSFAYGCCRDFISLL